MSENTATLHEWTREVPPAWDRRLAELFPRSELLSWLVLVWVPGEENDPIQRWCLYEATPRAFVPEFQQEALAYICNHEDPATHGAETRRIVDYWRETGALIEPFWVIQGEGGGHKYRFNKAEKRILRLMDLPDDPPVPGCLPYAGFDERVVRQLLKWNLLRKGYAELKGAHALELERGMKDFRRELVKWVGEMMDLDQTIGYRSAFHDIDMETGIPRTDERERVSVDRWERACENYIETGVFTSRQESRIILASR